MLFLVSIHPWYSIRINTFPRSTQIIFVRFQKTYEIDSCKLSCDFLSHHQFLELHHYSPHAGQFADSELCTIELHASPTEQAHSHNHFLPSLGSRILPANDLYVNIKRDMVPGFLFPYVEKGFERVCESTNWWECLSNFYNDFRNNKWPGWWKVFPRKLSSYVSNEFLAVSTRKCSTGSASLTVAITQYMK